MQSQYGQEVYGCLAMKEMPASPLRHVQSTGHLVACDASCTTIEAVSANVSELVDMDAAQLVGADAQQFFNRLDLHDIRNVLGYPDAETSRHMLSHKVISGRDYQMYLHRQGGRSVVELLPDRGLHHKRAVRLRRTYALFSMGLDHERPRGFLGSVAEYLRALLDYERVSVLQFSGETGVDVLAVSSVPGLTSDDDAYHASAGSNLRDVRVIGDALAETVPVIGQWAPDVSLAILAPATPNEATALVERGVRSVLAAPILLRGQTWGMIWCQSATAKPMDPLTIASAELASKIVGARFEGVLGPNGLSRA